MIRAIERMQNLNKFHARNIKYGVSIIGAGSISANYDEMDQEHVLTHAHAICEHNGYILKGFYDIDKIKSKNASKKWGGRAFANLDEALRDADIVCVSVPDKIHARIVEEALRMENVRAIICEKPYTLTLEEAIKLSELIENSDKTFLLNYSRRYMREFADLKNWIDHNAGNLICGNFFYGKGLLHNGSHFLDLIKLLLGEYRINHVLDKISDYCESDQSLEFVLDEVDGLGKIYFHVIDCRILTIFEMDLLFDRGRIRYSDELGTIEYYSVGGGGSPYKETNYNLERVISIDRSGAMRGLYNNLMGVLEKKDTPKCGYRDGLDLMKIINQINSKNSIKL